MPERLRRIEQPDGEGLLRFSVVILRVVFSPVVGAIVERGSVKLAWFTEAQQEPVFVGGCRLATARQWAEPVTVDSGTMHPPGKQTHLLPAFVLGFDQPLRRPAFQLVGTKVADEKVRTGAAEGMQVER
ncbi:MAG: hypothetical protein IT302_08535 [Dehalococcoidia bacterium]|nr:hypothetical protein [Dehalococcoidia bacterium]